MRPDGTLRPYTTIWVVRVGDDLYARSWRGRGGGWFRHALQRHQSRLRTGGAERDVTFEEPGDADHRAIEDAYRTKYARYAWAYVEPAFSPTGPGHGNSTSEADPRWVLHQLLGHQTWHVEDIDKRQEMLGHLARDVWGMARGSIAASPNQTSGA